VKNTQLLVASAVQTAHVEDNHTEEHIFPNLPATGARIGRYINAQHHNDGLFSEVFKAIDPDITDGTAKRLVALKITTPDLMKAPHDSQREARILEAAKGDHVIRLLETFQQSGGHLVLVFPFMPYGLDYLLQNDELTGASRRAILHDVVSGLAHIHGHGIIHRDIKPSNILLATPSGPAYLADFGIAWSKSDPASEPATEKILDIGTTCYRPPEILFGKQSYGTELDMWAAGCVAAQVACLGGQTLFDAGDLGSELALIKSIFETLGTPDLTTWHEAVTLPDWGKMSFVKYEGKRWEDILPGAEQDAVDLVRQLIRYESGERLSAEQVRHRLVVRGPMRGGN
jgi:cyclin-dependent kinase